MRRLLRWAFSGAAALSALFCVAACVLWLRTCRVERHWGQTLDWVTDGTAYQQRSGLFFSWGEISYASTVVPSIPQDSVADLGTLSPTAQPHTGWSVGSFQDFVAERDDSFLFGFGSNGNGRDYNVISVPFWFVIVMLAGPGLIRLAWRKSRPARLIEAYVALLIVGILLVMFTSAAALLPLIGLTAYAVFRVSFLGCLFLQRRWNRECDGPVCRSCGYDLRATPGRCPECGAIPKPKGAT